MKKSVLVVSYVEVRPEHRDERRFVIHAGAAAPVIVASLQPGSANLYAIADQDDDGVVEIEVSQLDDNTIAEAISSATGRHVRLVRALKAA